VAAVELREGGVVALGDAGDEHLVRLTGEGD
jgi:hypothetical protein